MPAMPAAMPKELLAGMLDTAAAVMGLSEPTSMAALLLAAVSRPAEFAALLFRKELGMAEPAPIPMKEGKTALLLGLLAFAFDPRLALASSASLQAAARHKLSARGI